MGGYHRAGYRHHHAADSDSGTAMARRRGSRCSTIESVAGRLYILEGMANKHSDQIDDIQKDIRYLQNEGARYDWELKQLQWLHPDLKVQPPDANPYQFKSTDLNLDMNPGKVPDVTKQNR
nr:hypothetical protein [Veillonella denticariosi]